MISDAQSRSIDQCGPGTRVEMAWDVTVAEVLRFAELSGDRSPIHISAESAIAKGFSGIVAHGALITAKFSALLGMELPGANGLLQSLELHFRKPVCPPCRLLLSLEVERVSAATGQLKLIASAQDLDGTFYTSGVIRSLVRP